MGKAMNVLVAGIALAAMFLQTYADEVEHDLAWTIPYGGAEEYTRWASANPLHIGGQDYDSIIFDFSPGEQDLAAVTKEDFDSCTTTSPLFVWSEPINYAPGYAGTHYFTCTFAGHCAKGQKIALTWANSSVPAPAPCPSSSATTYSALPLQFTPKRV